jgi:hypothetical protein
MIGNTVRTGAPFADRVQDSEAIAAVVNAACRRAVAAQGRAGLPAVVWRNGRVTWLPPSEVAKQVAADNPPWIGGIQDPAKDDPTFAEIVRLGQGDAQRPSES